MTNNDDALTILEAMDIYKKCFLPNNEGAPMEYIQLLGHDKKPLNLISGKYLTPKGVDKRPQSVPGYLYSCSIGLTSSGNSTAIQPGDAVFFIPFPFAGCVKNQLNQAKYILYSYYSIDPSNPDTFLRDIKIGFPAGEIQLREINGGMVMRVQYDSYILAVVNRLNPEEHIVKKAIISADDASMKPILEIK